MLVGHRVACVAFHCMDTPQLLFHSLVDEHLDCFYWFGPLQTKLLYTVWCKLLCEHKFLFLLLFSCLVISNSFLPHGLQHVRPPCPSPTPGVCLSSCPLHKFIQPSHPLMPSSPSALNLFQHQGLFQRVGCSYQVTKILELQLQHQFFQ